jgi:hypothetical protein
MTAEVLNEKTYHNLDKSHWPAGPWRSEPDKTQWTDGATGLPCLTVRHSSSGHLCGYVGVSDGHPLFAMSYSQCPKGCWDTWCQHSPESILDVHGGITFTDFCQEGKEETGVCHIPEPGQPGRVWWFGFDMAHSGDFCPAYDRSGEYRTLEYVRYECARLAQQLKEISNERPAPP